MLDKSAWLGVAGSGWCGALSWANSGHLIAILILSKSVFKWKYCLIDMVDLAKCGFSFHHHTKMTSDLSRWLEEWLGG